MKKWNTTKKTVLSNAEILLNNMGQDRDWLNTKIYGANEKGKSNQSLWRTDKIKLNYAAF